MESDIYIVELLGDGFLAVMAKPAAGECLEDNLSAVKAKGVNRVVSLLETAEQIEVGLGNEAAACQSLGLEYESYPIPDRGLPRSQADFRNFVRSLHQSILEGHSTVVHCRAGIGRSGLVAAGVLVQAGYAAAAAFELVSKARGVNVPETDEQRDSVIALARASTREVQKDGAATLYRRNSTDGLD